MNREQWLEARRMSIGASDVAAILGEDPRRGPLAIWDAKVNGQQDYDNDWLKFGRGVEGAIAGLYQSRTGREVVDLGETEITYHPDISWLGSTLDRKTARDEGPKGPLELKNVGTFDNPKVWILDPPEHYRIQLQIQIACLDSQWGALAAMFPVYQLQHRDYNRDDELLDLIYPELEKFWQCVIKKEQPKVDGLEGTAKVLKRLYPNDSGETIVLQEDSWVDLIEELKTTNKSIKDSEARKKEIQHTIKAAMQEATFAVLKNGTKVTSRTVSVAGRTQTVAGYSYRTFSVGKK
jgi:putative phage-type endonuclease